MKFKLYLIITLISILIIYSFQLYITGGEDKMHNELILNKSESDNEKNIREICGLFFPEKLFKNKKEKEIYIQNISSFYDIYKNRLKKIKLIKAKALYDTVFYFPDDTVFYYQNGRLIPERKLSDSSLYSSYFFKYIKGNYEIDKVKNEFPKPLCIDFYLKIYGSTPYEIFDNLGRTYVFGRRVSFNRQNRAIEKLNQAVKKISAESLKDPDLKKWIKSIRTVETYIHRNIANDKRISLHSLGIAIDIKPRSEKESYWYWSENFRKDWWNIPKEQRVYIPQKVIDAFEESGFVWGGKWLYFDNMHFEYRPEVLL